MNIGERVRYEREKRGLSLRGLSLKCKNTNYATIYKIEKGSNATYDTLLDIAQALNIDVSYLVNQDDKAKPITLSKLTSACEKAGVDPKDIDQMSQEQIDLAVNLFKQLLNNKK